MAANDDMSELDIQERTQTAAGAAQPTSRNHDISMAGEEHVQSGDLVGQLGVKELSAITAFTSEGGHPEPFTAAVVPNSFYENAGDANCERELKDVATFVTGADRSEHTVAGCLDTKLAETTIAGNHGRRELAPTMDGPQKVPAVQDQREDNMAPDSETNEADEPLQHHQGRRAPISANSHGVSSPARQLQDVVPSGNEEDEQESGDEEYLDDEAHGSEDDNELDEDEEEDIAEFQSKLKQSVARRNPHPKPNWNRRHELFEGDADVQEVPHLEFDRNFQAQLHIRHGPGFNGYAGPHQAQQLPPHGYDSRFPNPFPGGVYSEHQTPSFMSALQPARMPATPNTPHLYAPNYPYNLPQGQHAMGYQDPRYQPYGQGSFQSGYTPLPASPYEMHGRGFQPPPPPEHYQPPARGIAMVQNVQQRGVAKKQVSEASNTSDDDEPLRTRVTRHPSKVSDAVKDSAPPPPKATKRGKQQKQESDSDVEKVSSQVKTKPKLGFKEPKATKAAPKKSTPAQQPAQPTQAQSDDHGPTSEATIDWKLPRYEAKFEAPKTKDDPTVAKISIPNLVREELLLSPDHAEQETHLLLHIFLPAHQALAQPDPHPANAVYNFHTIALMVIEAFVQFEIGDEYGKGRGHWHDAHDQSDVEYLRQRSAKDADPDEIFFAVIDRWRAGIESNKDSAKHIRGVQEFCDVALDVIYYIKEHGLLKERQNVWEEKGGKKGARKVGEEEEGKGAGGAKVKKRTAAPKELTARKKPKTAQKAKRTIEVRKKPKMSTGGVVVKRRT